MPAKSKAQQRFFGAELARAKAGKKTKTGLPASTLKEFASTKTDKLPSRVQHERHMLRDGHRRLS